MGDLNLELFVGRIENGALSINLKRALELARVSKAPQFELLLQSHENYARKVAETAEAVTNEIVGAAPEPISPRDRYFLLKRLASSPFIRQNTKAISRGNYSQSIPKANEAALTKARADGKSYKAELLRQPGMLSAEEAAVRLHRSRQTINNQRLAGKILGLDFGGASFRYPDWQFHDEIYGPRLATVLGALGSLDPWIKFRFLTTAEGMLGGLSPVDVLKLQSRPLADVVRAARAFVEE